MYELIRVGQERLIGEIIRLENDSAIIQVTLFAVATVRSGSIKLIWLCLSID